MQLTRCHLLRSGLPFACAADMATAECTALLGQVQRRVQPPLPCGRAHAEGTHLARAQSPVAFGTYNSFFTHGARATYARTHLAVHTTHARACAADNICFYVESKWFAAASERAVNGLYTVTVDAAAHLSRFHRRSGACVHAC